MVENQTGRENNSDDLDLVNLLYRVFSFFKKNSRVMAVFTVAGLVIGYALYKVSPRVYESTLLLHSQSLTNTEQINII